MTRATIEHNLSESELVSALTALATSAEIGEELQKAIKAKLRPAVDLEPKEPRHPAMRHLYRLFLQQFEEANRDIERYAAEILADPLNKSQMSLFDWQPHHAEYDRKDPRTGKLEHIAAKGTQHHDTPPPSLKQEEAIMETNLQEQLDAYKPHLVGEYAKDAARRLAWLQKNYGSDLKGRDNQGRLMRSASPATGKMWSENTQPLTTRDADGNYHIDDAKVLKAGLEYADATVEAWRYKIIGKVNDLQAAKVHSLGGARFTITGKLGDKIVSIEQNMIVNRSINGNLYNQFPARIYVAGKFTSEAAYKKLTGADQAEEKAAEDKRQANMLPGGRFAKRDKVILRLKKKGSDESYQADGIVTGERDGKILIAVKTWGRSTQTFAIDHEKLARWNA